MKEIVDSFVAYFATQYREYEAVRLSVRSTIEEALKDEGIMAIVSARVKDKDRLAEKLYNRDQKKHYQRFQDIYDDIPDLIGARIALYFPSDAQRIGKVLEKHFQVVKEKVFPEPLVKNSDCGKCEKCVNCQDPDFTANQRKVYKGYDNRRFDGYCAVHYRVHLKDNLAKLIGDPLIEVQVASVLMHAWSEVEHDLAYKKKRGQVSREEYEALDEINGLVIAGEIALNRLDQLFQQRITKENGVFSTHYALAAYLSEWLEAKTGEAGKPLGDTELLFWVWQRKRKNLNWQTVDKDLKGLDYKPDEFLATQLIDLLSDGDAALTTELMKKRYKASDFQDAEVYDQVLFGKYIKNWIGVEKAVKMALKRLGYKVSNSSDVWRVMTDEKDIAEEVRKEYRRLRLERNKIAHGNYVPTTEKYNELELDMIRFLELLAEKYPAE